MDGFYDHDDGMDEGGDWGGEVEAAPLRMEIDETPRFPAVAIPAMRQEPSDTEIKEAVERKYAVVGDDIEKLSYLIPLNGEDASGGVKPLWALLVRDVLEWLANQWDYHCKEEAVYGYCDQAKRDFLSGVPSPICVASAITKSHHAVATMACTGNEATKRPFSEEYVRMVCDEPNAVFASLSAEEKQQRMARDIPVDDLETDMLESGKLGWPEGGYRIYINRETHFLQTWDWAREKGVRGLVKKAPLPRFDLELRDDFRRHLGHAGIERIHGELPRLPWAACLHEILYKYCVKHPNMGPCAPEEQAMAAKLITRVCGEWAYSQLCSKNPYFEAEFMRRSGRKMVEAFDEKFGGEALSLLDWKARPLFMEFLVSRYPELRQAIAQHSGDEVVRRMDESITLIHHCNAVSPFSMDLLQFLGPMQLHPVTGARDAEEDKKDAYFHTTFGALHEVGHLYLIFGEWEFGLPAVVDHSLVGPAPPRLPDPEPDPFNELNPPPIIPECPFRGLSSPAIPWEDGYGPD